MTTVRFAAPFATPIRASTMHTNPGDSLSSAVGIDVEVDSIHCSFPDERIALIIPSTVHAPLATVEQRFILDAFVQYRSSKSFPASRLQPQHSFPIR